jgi:2-aminoethylphosphonate-pyruvate transaminase
VLNQDFGSRDTRFIKLIAAIRRKLLELAGLDVADWTTVIVQGSGTFGVESVLGSALPNDGRLLVISNGAYGERMARIAACLRIEHQVFRTPEHTVPTDLEAITTLARNFGATAVAYVHSETTTGILNPLSVLTHLKTELGLTVILDAMSSFGGVYIPPDTFESIDFLVSSSNKCIQGIPGFAFVLARKTALQRCEGQARSVSLDLYDQWKGLETNGQFRFTPPTHVIAAFAQAIDELQEEGGITAREQRYRQNHQVVLSGYQSLGFRPYLASEVMGPIITSFHYPSSSNFTFEQFYAKLNERGMVIYPGKLSEAACFRIGHIGHLFPSDMEALVEATAEVCRELHLEPVA